MDSTEEENLDEWELPKYSRMPVATTHQCPSVKHGGKSWSVWLERGERCPVCSQMELDEEGNRV